MATFQLTKMLRIFSIKQSGPLYSCNFYRHLGTFAQDHTLLQCSKLNCGHVSTVGAGGLFLSGAFEQRRYKKPLYLYKRIQPTRIIKFDNAGDLVQEATVDTSSLHYAYERVKDIDDVPKDLRQIFTLKFADGQSVLDHRHHEMNRHIESLLGEDCELEKEIASITVAIRRQIAHLMKYKKDNRTKVQIVSKINRRRRYLTRLRETDFERFMWILKELRIQYRLEHKPAAPPTRKNVQRLATLAEAEALKNEKIAELQAEFAKEREKFDEYKRRTLTEIEADMTALNLTQEDIAETIKKVSAPPEPDVSTMSQKDRYFYEKRKAWENRWQYEREVPPDLPPRPF